MRRPVVGTRLSHYQILEVLGAGGMGVVYRARDERLERDVAIKVLPEGSLANDSTRRQFRKEALALSRLNHPNIATVHDFDSQDGADFLVLELVHGETLSDRIAGTPLPEEEVIRLGEQLAEGLAAAHRERVLHRDIKPGNLRLTREGRLKILDFGLAKLVRLTGELPTSQTATAGDRVAGTLPYMSPEQLRGDTLDPRSDLYAVGAVLYEMACGRRAFPQDSSPALVGAILGHPPTPPHEISPGISADLERIILRCLEKAPADRYKDASELATDLHKLRTPESGRRPSQSTPRRRRQVLGAAAAAIGAAALVLVLNIGGMRDRIFQGRSAGTIQALAVLPLLNLSRDPEQDYFVDGMTEELIHRLSQVGSLRVIARSSVMALKGTKDPPSQIAKMLGVGHLVDGSVTRSGSRVRISAELIGAQTQQVIWAGSYERDIQDVFMLQTDVAKAITAEIRARLTTSERARLTQPRQVSPAAHEAYLRGRYAISKRDSAAIYKGLNYFLEAVRIDSTYALAWVGVAYGNYGISNIYVPPAIAMPRVRAAAERAISLDPDLAEAHAWRAVPLALYEWNWAEADREFAQAFDLNPSLAEANQFYAVSLMYRGRLDEALSEFRRVQQLDPLADYLGGIISWCLYFKGSYEEAATDFRRRLEIDSRVSDIHAWLGLCYLRQGKKAEALKELRVGADLADHAWPIAQYGYALGVLGHREEAEAVLKKLLQPRAGAAIHSYSVALVYVGLGDRQHAFDWLEKAYADRSEDLPMIHVDPAWDSVKSDPRYQSLLRRMNLTLSSKTSAAPST